MKVAKRSIQMVPGYVFFIFFAIILYYACSSDNSTQFTATASAIRQIWSRGCGLSCRPSGISGLSGLADPPCQTGPSRDDCACDTCPCAMIENILRTCSPATRLYTDFCNILSFCYENIKKSAMEAFEFATRVLECRTACQRQAQIIGTRDSSSDDFNFGDNVEAKPETTSKVPNIIRSAVDLTKALIKKKSSITFKEPPLESSSEEEGSHEGKSSAAGKSSSKSSGLSILKSKSTETLKPKDSTGYCSKCVEEGKVCMNECPRAKKP